MILVEITAALNATGALKTFYLSNGGFVSSPTDVPANTAFMDALEDPGSLGITAFADGTTGGNTVLQTGEILLVNDGSFDTWKDYSFDGRPIVIRVGNPENGYPSACPILFTGTVIGADVTLMHVAIRLRDKQIMFQTPLLSLYGGTNALPAGVDGTPNDIKGKGKPRTYGSVFNVSPPCVNTSLLIYQVNDSVVSDIAAVYDRGQNLTKGANYATNALLQAATGMSAGSYITCFAEGLFRLASNPTGTITADVVQGGGAGNRTAAQVLRQIAVDAGLPSASISTSDMGAMDALNSAVVGIYIDDETSTALTAMDTIANSIGAYFGFDPSGTLRMGVLTNPSGTPVLSIADDLVLPGIERRTATDNDIPRWAINLNYAKVWTVQTTDVAGVVTNAVRAFIGNEFRTAHSEDTSVKNQYLLSTILSVDTALATLADAQAEADRRLTLVRFHRDVYDIPVPLDIVMGSSLRMLSVISLTYNRFGLSAGKLFRVIGINLALKSNTIILTVWG